MRVCPDCEEPTALMQIGEFYRSGKLPGVPGNPPPARRPELEVQTSGEEREAMKRARPSAGELLGARSHIRLVRGSKQLASGDIAECAAGSNLSLMRVAADANDVYERYVAQLRREARPSVRRADIAGEAVRQTNTEYGSIIMVEGHKSTLITVVECYDD